MGEQEEAGTAAISPDLKAILEAQKDAILVAVDSQIKGLQKNLLQPQTDLASEIAASERAMNSSLISIGRLRRRASSS